jgi:hypothetical protein
MACRYQRRRTDQTAQTLTSRMATISALGQDAYDQHPPSTYFVTSKVIAHVRHWTVQCADDFEMYNSRPNVPSLHKSSGDVQHPDAGLKDL